MIIHNFVYLFFFWGGGGGIICKCVTCGTRFLLNLIVFLEQKNDNRLPKKRKSVHNVVYLKKLIALRKRKQLADKKKTQDFITYTLIFII